MHGWIFSIYLLREHWSAYHNSLSVCSGTAPGIFIMEAMIDHVARSLNMDVGVVKRANLYKQGQVTMHVNCPYV